MSVDALRFLADLRADPRCAGRMVHHRRLPERPARFQDPARPLPPQLAERLSRNGIEHLYTHQAQAVDAARAGKHVVTVTSTASGKTLCYNLPVLETLLKHPRSRALYLFPTKALAQDQLGKLRDFHLFPQVRPATYDGDTPSPERSRLKREMSLILTNPDMLHMGIIPYHGTWASYLRNLRYVVVDEIHTYRGVFGSHVANVLRRLRRICRLYGADPQFLCCSATVANPGELMRGLIGEGGDIREIADDGSPTGARHVLFWNPPLVGQGAGRASANVEATRLLVDLVRRGVRTILFTRARKTAELILRYARYALQDEAPALAGRITSYRAGYSVEQRRQIERGLFEGDILGVVSTNALELGVDIGDVDACVLTGYPGSIASTWQQAGRSGRGSEESLVVLVALDGPLDQYLMNHPEYLFGSPPEHAIIDPRNPQILAPHLACAAYERPLQPADAAWFGPATPTLTQQLMREGQLMPRGDGFGWCGTDYPPARVNIRSATNEQYRIITRETGEVIGTAESARAFETLHEGAIYLHQGEAFRVVQLDIPGLRAIVEPATGDYYTEPRSTVDVVLETPVGRRDMARNTAPSPPPRPADGGTGARVHGLASG